MYAPPKCVSNTQKITHAVDNILLKHEIDKTTRLKKAWGLPNVTHDDDFAALLALGVEGWQSRNWDPEVSSPWFDYYCGNITSEKPLNPYTTDDTITIKELLHEGGYEAEVDALTIPMLNWIAWSRRSFIDKCDVDQDSCFGSHDPSFYHRDDINQDWRAWPYQFCTQWGYLQRTNTPNASILPITSRLLDLKYHSRICEQAFNITTPADTAAINKHGGFNISYPRLAIIDGEQDPWRPATPHASPFDYYQNVGNRTGSTSEPWLLMRGAVHHWDENGLADNGRGKTPHEVHKIQREEVKFVQEWLKEWRDEKVADAQKFEL